MTLSRRIEYTLQAETDIDGILRYTRKTWGERQRDIYAQKLVDGFETLARFPDLGEERDDLARGLYSRRIEQYIVYYRASVETLTIVRLRHVKANTIRPSEL